MSVLEHSLSCLQPWTGKSAAADEKRCEKLFFCWKLSHGKVLKMQPSIHCSLEQKWSLGLITCWMSRWEGPQRAAHRRKKRRRTLAALATLALLVVRSFNIGTFHTSACTVGAVGGAVPSYSLLVLKLSHIS